MAEAAREVPVFTCHDCTFATALVERAERHEHVTGHDVWEED